MPQTLQEQDTYDAASLYVFQACRKLVSLFTIPYLAGVLGPSGWVASLGLTSLYAVEILK